MKPNSSDNTYASIEQHIRQAHLQRAAFLGGLMSSAFLAAARAFTGITSRITTATQARARRPQLAPR
jgi:hypothetical protein